MQLVIAAITTWPWSSVGLGAVGERDRRLARCGARRPAAPPVSPCGASPSLRDCRWWPGRRRPGSDSSSASSSSSSCRRRRAAGPPAPSGTRRLDSVSETRSCGRFGPGDRRHHVGQVELDVIGERRLLGVLVVPQALLLGVGLDERDLLGRAAGELQVAQRLGVDREDRAGRAELRRHVADRRPVGQRQPGQPGAVELDELADDAALAQHLGDGQHQVGGGRALGQLAGELEAEHLRDQHRHRLAEHRRLGLDPADAPAEHAEPVDHRRVRVGPDQRVGVGLAAASSLTNTTRARYSRLTWWTIPVSGGTTSKLSKRALAPAQERVALLVALELELGVVRERLRGAERVDLDRVVDHQLGGDQRVDLLRVAADLGHRVAHRRQVDDRRARR